MTREEMLFQLKDLKRHCEDMARGELLGLYWVGDDALDIVIKALEQQPCEERIVEWKKDFKEYVSLLTMPRDDYNGIMEYIDELPSITPKSKTGHWIEEDMFDGDVAYKCSECGELFWLENGTPKDNEYNFCPKCGARMTESEDKE